MIYRLEFVIVETLAALVKRLPLSMASGLARYLGSVAYVVMGERRKIALENIGKAFGDSLSHAEKKRIVRLSFQNAALSVMELFVVEKVRREAPARFQLTGNEILEHAFSKGNGVVLVITHLGSWEYLSFLPYLTGRPWSVVVKALKNPYLDEAIDALRRTTTVTPIPKVHSIKGVLRELKHNHGAAILIDQWAGPEGLWIDFFGVPTSTTSLPVRLAKKTGCALVPAYCLRLSTGFYNIHICPPVSLDPKSNNWEESVTKELNKVFEVVIREHPEQWLWIHRRWKDKPKVWREVRNVL